MAGWLCVYLEGVGEGFGLAWVADRFSTLSIHLLFEGPVLVQIHMHVDTYIYTYLREGMGGCAAWLTDDRRVYNECNECCKGGRQTGREDHKGL
mmetsp:Transcript_21811/g.53456  ORF Transcript_21811/g.53456 Transcript_21811/m.53456 type:complete len:94 (+) Transcript_21811:389-670(+)